MLCGLAVYIPSNIWPKVKEPLVEDVGTIKMGDVADFQNFMGAVIDSAAFETRSKAIADARSAGAEILTAARRTTPRATSSSRP